MIYILYRIDSTCSTVDSIWKTQEEAEEKAENIAMLPNPPCSSFKIVKWCEDCQREVVRFASSHNSDNWRQYVWEVV